MGEESVAVGLAFPHVSGVVSRQKSGTVIRNKGQDRVGISPGVTTRQGTKLIIDGSSGHGRTLPTNHTLQGLFIA